MMVKAIAQVTDTGVKLPEHFYQALRSNVGKRVRLTLSTDKPRSNPQNAYYWGAVLPLITETFNENECALLDPDDMHFWLKLNVTGMVKYALGAQGEVIAIPKSTKDLSTKAFNDMVDMICAWAAERYGLHVPPPDEFNALSKHIDIYV